MPTASEYTIGWISALSIELVAAQVFLDEKHEALKVSANDNNTYVLGRIGEHNIVIAVLPDGEYGVTSAATVARDMLHSFPNVKLGLMVGIGGGIPSKKHDIRLGDVVVSTPYRGAGGVVQYDYGKSIQDQKFHRTGFLDQPPTALRTAISALKAHHEIEGSRLDEAVDSILDGKRRLKAYRKPAPDTDRLYKADFVHPDSNSEECENICGLDPLTLHLRLDRDKEDEDDPAIHYGLVASGSSLVKDARLRDKLSEELDVLCFEMEAAGLMNHFPCVVIRGICDYSDTHKNDRWQRFAAMTAAAYAKDLLRWVSATRVEGEQTINDTLKSLGSSMNNIEESMKKTEYDRLKNEVKALLRAPDPSTNWATALQQRHPGTGQWFIDSAAFHKWSSEPNAFLWLYGIPGCGKSVLSATIIEHMSARSSTLLYFYFSFSDSSKQTLDNMIRSLIWQMWEQVSGFEFVDSLLSSHLPHGRQPTTEELCNTFASMRDNVEELCIVLDGIDECSTRRGGKTQSVLAWIEDLVASKSRNLRVLITGRPEKDIDMKLRRWSSHNSIICIQSDLIENDIDAYIRFQVKEGEELRRWRNYPDIQREVIMKLNEKANGMFRWAALQLEALGSCLDYSALQDALETLPDTLDETYDRIFDQIPRQRKPKAIRLLQLLSYAKRPLSIEELVDAVAVDAENETPFRPRDRLPDPGEIAAYCSSFVAFISSNTDDDANNTDERSHLMLRLAHFSVKEYFTSDRLNADLSEQFQEVQARTSIAKICVAYLLCVSLSIPLIDVEQEFPFANYAAESWIEHAITKQPIDMQLHKLIMRFFLAPNKLHRIWYFLHDPEAANDQSDDYTWASKRHYGCRPQPASMLFYACHGGLTFEVKSLLEIKSSMSNHEELEECFLAACSHGYVEIVSMLLKQNISIHTERRKGNGLCIAAQRGHLGVVNLLLEHGFDPNADGENYGIPIRAAIAHGFSSILKALIDHNVDIDYYPGYTDSHIDVAVRRADRAILLMLLEAGTDTTLKRTRWKRAMSASLLHEREDIIDFMISQYPKNCDMVALFKEVLATAWSQRARELLVAATVRQYITYYSAHLPANRFFSDLNDSFMRYTTPSAGRERHHRNLKYRRAKSQRSAHEKQLSATLAVALNPRESATYLFSDSWDIMFRHMLRLEQANIEEFNSLNHGSSMRCLMSRWSKASYQMFLDFDDKSETASLGKGYCAMLDIASRENYEKILRVLLPKAKKPFAHSDERRFAQVLFKTGERSARRRYSRLHHIPSRMEDKKIVEMLLFEPWKVLFTEHKVGIVQLMRDVGICTKFLRDFGAAVYLATLTGRLEIVQMLFYVGATLTATLPADSRILDGSFARQLFFILRNEFFVNEVLCWRVTESKRQQLSHSLRNSKDTSGMQDMPHFEKGLTEWGVAIRDLDEYHGLLSKAIQYGKEVTVHLIQAGAVVHPWYLITPSRRGNEEMVKILLDACSDRTVRKQALLVAMKSCKDYAFFRVLLEQCRPSDIAICHSVALTGAVYREDEHFVGRLLQDGADPNYSGDMRLLRHACFNERRRIAVLLVEYGARIPRWI